MFGSTKSKLYFLVILGDLDNSHYNHMRDRLGGLGKTHRLMDKVTGEDLGYCFVIRLNKDFSSAWNLTRENSEYLLSIIEELQDGKTE